MPKPHGKGGRPRTQKALDLTKERARQASESANKLALGNARLRGELLPADVIAQVWNAMLSNFRARLLQMPSKLLPLIEAASSKAEAKQIMEVGVNECLNELANFDVSKIIDEQTDSTSHLADP